MNSKISARTAHAVVLTKPRIWASAALLAIVGSVALVASGAGTAPNIPAVNLSTDPLYAVSGGDRPVIALGLSVEFPTVGAQYLEDNYSNTNEFLGYYDAESCYTYNKQPTETPAAGQTSSDYKRFDRSGAATNRMCVNAFSGNFLNWASSSAIDMLRLALSGGDRYIDTPSLTILQRAVIPNGDPRCFWNTSNFPAKRLRRDGFTTGAYWGAVPAAMITQAAGSDIYVANTLNQIFFGTSATGGCGNTGAYVLGTGTPAAGVLQITYGPGSRPGGFPTGATCNYGESCGGSGLNEILYGRSNGSDGSKWVAYVTSGAVTCDQNNFLLGSTNTGAKCYVRPYTGSITAPAASTGLTDDPFFYSRVQVCNKSGSALADVRDYGLCTAYPNGNFKPTGSIQKYSDQLRLAAFGYLMDQTQSSSGGRYGGVLRAPVKFVGAKTFSETGVDNTPAAGNPAAEWDASTGVFKANPDNDTTQTVPISGVINYLNKFGRTGPVAGRYKIYDAVGELYGEALRYLQGLGPTEAAVINITPDMSDGFPVTTSWTDIDPYGGSRSSTADYSCLKSNIVMIGDVNTHDSDRLFTRTASLADNLPDFSGSGWKGTVAKFEANTSGTYIDGQGVSRAIGNFNPANTSAQTVASGTQVLTGQAYWTHTHDIRGTDWTAAPNRQRPGLRVKSYFFDVNEGGKSTITTSGTATTDIYRRTQNAFFTASKYGGFETDASNVGNNPYNTYGNPFKKQDGTNNNNVWQDAANPGEAGTYYLQSSARNVLSAFDSIFSRAASNARSIAGSAASNRNITQTGSTVYQAAFDTLDWSGDVLSIPLTVSTSNVVTAGTTPNWSASTRLSALTAPATSRTIVVGRSGASAVPTATSFTWAAIDTTLQTTLQKVSPTAANDGLGQARLDYLRGDRSREGSPFRIRSKLLGDVINSGIVYSGAPNASLAGAGYSGFYTANASRTPAVFVGANDGMLHAFNATNGDELFGYIPSWMSSKLAALTSTTYNTNHQLYVDSTPAVAEAQVGTAGTSADWKTVLVSGTGGGGAGVFALDVTNPSTFSSTQVMWEFTQADDADLGYVIGKPQIVKMRTSAGGVSPATYKWFAMVASGVNSYVPNPMFGGTYGSGNPALFLLALDKQAGAAWSATGTTPNYYKITLPFDATLGTTNATGLINFRPVFGGSGGVDQVYAGDLHGNLWKLDFSLHGSSEWNMNKLSAYNKGTTASPIPYPLYIAKTGTTTPVNQAISMAPSVVAGPVLRGLQTRYVLFGTGKYLETSDKTSTNQNTFYAIYDDGSTTADSNPASASIVSGRGRLQPATFNSSTGAVTVSAFTWGRPSTDTATATRAGWYLDFPGNGERLINNATVVGNKVNFGSLIPSAAGAAGSCSATGGSGREYELDLDTGNGTSAVSTVGLLGESLILEIDSATTYTTSTNTGRRVKKTVRQVIQQGSTGINPSRTISTDSIAGRLSWRQINNYQDLKNKP